MTKTHENPVSVDELRRILSYSPETGEFCWKIARTGKPPKQFGVLASNGYLLTRINYKKYLLHRLAWAHTYGYWPETVDHINRDKTDNRIANLREATRSQNLANRTVRAKSGYKGVVRIKGRYRAGITIGGKSHYLGLYLTPEEAHARYAEEARKVFGEFSCLQ